MTSFGPFLSGRYLFTVILLSSSRNAMLPTDIDRSLPVAIRCSTKDSGARFFSKVFCLPNVRDFRYRS